MAKNDINSPIEEKTHIWRINGILLKPSVIKTACVVNRPKQFDIHDFLKSFPKNA